MHRDQIIRRPRPLRLLEHWFGTLVDGGEDGRVARDAEHEGEHGDADDEGYGGNAGPPGELVVDVDPFEEGGKEIGGPPGRSEAEVGKVADLVV